MKRSIRYYLRGSGASGVRKPISLLVVIVAIGGVGVYMLANSHAATPVANIEAENGTISSAASSVNDASASNGKAVKFGPGGGSGGGGSADFCSTFPALPSSKPIASNTGVPAGTTLTPSGTITVSTNGAVISGKNVTGEIDVQANNVTIKDNNINAQGHLYAIKISGGSTGTTVINNEAYTTTGGYTGIEGDGNTATICGNYLYGFENGMSLTGGNMMVQANFIEKLASYQTGPHYDGIELYNGSNNKFYGNNIMMTDSSGNWLTETGAINVTGQYGEIDNTTINGNWLNGGSFTLNTDDTKGYAINGLVVTNNVFGGSPPAGYAQYGPVRESSVVTTWSGNTWSDTGGTVSP